MYVSMMIPNIGEILEGSEKRREEGRVTEGKKGRRGEGNLLSKT